MSEGDDFIQLKALWYKRLKDSGFKDIETFNGYIKDWPSQRIQRDFTPERIQEKLDYFRAASQLFWEHKFDTALQKKIWELHCEGKSYREIAEDLRNKKNKLNKDNVQLVISKLAKVVYSRIMNEEE